METRRRDFLRMGIAAAAFAVLGRPGRTENGAPDLAVVKGKPEDAVRKAVDLLGGMGRFVKSGSEVLLKPNIGFSVPPENGATTTPIVVAAVARMCLSAGARRVIVADHPVQNPELCLKRSGIAEALDGMGAVHLMTPSREEFYEERSIPKGVALKKTKVLRALLKADVFINLPCAKSHGATGVSLGLKNLMGAIWDRETFHRDIDIDQGIADLAAAVKPHLTVVDATRALVDGGPAGPGTIENLGTIVAGTDPVAVDSCTVSLAKWYGKTFTGRNIRHLVAASDLGLGQIDVSKLRIAEEAL